MIKSWKHEGLEELFKTGKSRKVGGDLQKRCIHRMTVLNSTTDLRTLYDYGGFAFHKYPNFENVYSIKVSGAWRIIFNWSNGDAYNVDLTQPHGVRGRAG